MRSLKKASSILLALAMTLSCVTISYAQEPPFSDISGSWAAEYIVQGHEMGLFDGDGGGLFVPENPLTRAELVQTLYNLEGRPETAGESSFTDGNGMWYTDAVVWAEQNGILTGRGDGSCGALDHITRQEMVTILYRYDGARSAAGDLTAFPDHAEVADWAQAGMSWAIAQGIVNGLPAADGSLTLSPTALTDRASFAKLMVSYISGLGQETTGRAYIEETLNLKNNADQAWTYSASADAWTLSVVSAVAYPELPGQQGVSVCVPGAYVTGIDTDGDGAADVTSSDASGAVKGALVIDYEAQITSANGQVYTAATAPVILNTGAAGYGSQNNSVASTTHAANGYINVSCGNRGKQDTATDENGDTYYTGDAPSCLVDQKAAARYVKYNILLGNLPGDAERFISTGGSGGGAHATMFAATSNNPDYYDYQIEAGAVGVYKNEDGSYSTTVTIDGEAHEISDGAWGCIAYSAITSLYEADMALAFEYYLNPAYDFNTPFQAQMAEYLSAEYMEYINDQALSVREADVGFDLNADGDMEDEIALTIEYDPETHADTNGYYGSYLDLYLAEFTQNLQWYLDNLDYAEGWTWFDADGAALSDEAVAAMTAEEKALAFLEGRYTKSSSGGMGGMPGGMGGPPAGGPPSAPPGGMPGGLVGTPGGGTTQSSTGSADSANYATYEEMVAAYRADIEAIYAGDKYGKNIVELYDPARYIGAAGTEDPAWVKIIMGASEGDISMLNSLNLQLKWLSAGVDAVIEWQWDGSHVPSEVLGDSFSLYVDQMFGEYAGGTAIVKPQAAAQTANGTSATASGTDISGWVVHDELSAVSFSLADAAAYRTAGASKAIPGFDVIDYGQEDYVFGSAQQDARHWNIRLLEIFEAYGDVLAPLFNGGN